VLQAKEDRRSVEEDRRWGMATAGAGRSCPGEGSRRSRMAAAGQEGRCQGMAAAAGGEGWPPGGARLPAFRAGRKVCVRVCWGKG
jgi:hypothetical protein